MKTERMLELRERMKKENKNWKAIVVNFSELGHVESSFNSESHSLKNILHKIELDLMTNLSLGLDTPIVIVIKELKENSNEK